MPRKAGSSGFCEYFFVKMVPQNLFCIALHMTHGMSQGSLNWPLTFKSIFPLTEHACILVYIKLYIHRCIFLTSVLPFLCKMSSRFICWEEGSISRMVVAVSDTTVVYYTSW
jgi:hypothetical protein